jgi:hypothetical protein
MNRVASRSIRLGLSSRSLLRNAGQVWLLRGFLGINPLLPVPPGSFLETVMRTSRFFPLLLFGLSAAMAPYLYAQRIDPDSLLQEADAVIEGTSEVRGLSLKSRLDRSVKDRIEMTSILNRELREQYARRDAGREGAVFQALGLIPATTSFEDTVIRLLSESVESRYDPRRKVLYIASWLPGSDQKSILAHETARALQDQNFDMDAIEQADLDGQDWDRMLAHQAVFEGDRTVVMLQTALEREKRHFSDLPDLAYVMQSWMATTLSQDDASSSAPEFIKQVLLFPYGHGASFLQGIWKKTPGWDSINELYLDLPSSTEQILHPEKYYGTRDDPKPVVPIDPAARLGSGWRVVYRNVLGEFTLGLLLNLHFTEEYSAKVVTGWGGDSVTYLENETGGNALFVNTIWDTHEDAEEFFQAMDTWFRKRFPDAKRENERSDGFSLIQKDTFYDLRFEGESVYFVSGLSVADGRRWMGK